MVVMKPNTYLEVSRGKHGIIASGSSCSAHGGTESRFAEAPEKSRAAMIVGVKRASE